MAVSFFTHLLLLLVLDIALALVLLDTGVFENNAHLSGGRTCCFTFSLRSSPPLPPHPMLGDENMLSVFRNKRSYLLAPRFRGLARRPRNPTLYSGGKGGRRRSNEKKQMSVIFENTGLRIFHVLTETTLAGINVSDPDTKNMSRFFPSAS